LHGKKKPLPNPKFLKELKAFGYQRIIGIDEVGRGALAGPIVVSAVEIYQPIDAVNDSKLLSAGMRQKIAEQISRRSEQISFGQASNDEIDQLGLAAAQRLAYQRCLEFIEFDLVLTDYYVLKDIKHIKAIKGDQLFYPVAAASIMAKVYRDQLMRTYHHFHPGFGWDKNVGYGTSEHLRFIKSAGSSPLHRISFLH